MYELRKDDFVKVLPLFTKLDYNLTIESILCGHTIGRVFIDNLETPKAVLVWNTLDTIFIAGDQQKTELTTSLRRLFFEVLIPDAKKYCVPCFSIHYVPNGWEMILDTVLQDQDVKVIPRHFYNLNQLLVDWNQLLPASYTMHRIDNSLFDIQDYNNARNAMGWVFSFWETIEDFGDQGVGFYILHNHDVVSWCLSIAVGDGRVELGLATAEEYRKRGFATMVGAACVEYYLKSGIQPVWHCDAQNTGSNQVARNIGFEKVKDYSVYYLEF